VTLAPYCVLAAAKFFNSACDVHPNSRNRFEPKSRLTDLNRWPSLYLCPRTLNASHRRASATPFIKHWQTCWPTSRWASKGQIRNELKLDSVRSGGSSVWMAWCGFYLRVYQLILL
jgi:hypothetical protein